MSGEGGEARTARPTEKRAEPKTLPGFIQQAPEMIAPADVSLAAFHLSRYERSEAERVA